MYRRYAERYILPSQFDEADVSAYVELARSPPQNRGTSLRALNQMPERRARGSSRA